MSKLPPLATLQALEVVCRRRSFQAAAAELSLTASAISHQMARLEAAVGVRLLDRTSAGVHPTPEGERYLQRVSGALAALTAATTDLHEGAQESLYVHCSPSLASLWLMPRLADFAQAHPEISLHLSASHIHSDFLAGHVDLDLRYGAPRWPNLHVEALFTEQVAPLASPDLIAKYALKKSLKPAQLLDVPLIQSTVSLVQWSDWFAAQTLAQTPARFALRFDRAQLSLDAAVQGLGVALESTTMAASHLAAKRLQPLFSAKRAVAVEGHFLVLPARHLARIPVQQFMQWLEKMRR